MFETSRDILYLVISFCVLWITVFLCWMFYYVTRILRNTNQIVEEFRVRLQVLTDAVHYIRSKVEQISGLLTMASEGVGGLVKNAVSRKAKEWMDKGTEKANDAAKEAVDMAVEATAKKIKKMAKRIKK